MELDIEKAIEMINNGKSQKGVAREFEVPETTLRNKIKDAGYKRDKDTKQYVLNAPNNETTNERFQPKKEVSAETKKHSANERKHDTIKEQEIEPTKEEKAKGGKSNLRKRASFDIDNELLKELKIFAIMEDKNVYEIVEQAIKNYLKERK